MCATHHLNLALLVSRRHDRIGVGRVLVDAAVVQPIVLIQLGLGTKTIAARRARIWRVTRVHSMNGQIKKERNKETLI